MQANTGMELQDKGGKNEPYLKVDLEEVLGASHPKPPIPKALEAWKWKGKEYGSGGEGGTKKEA